MPRVVHVIEPRERETRWMWKLPVIRKRLAVLERQARCASHSMRVEKRQQWLREFRGLCKQSQL